MPPIPQEKPGPPADPKHRDCVNPHEYQRQLETVIQILKDRVTRYDKPRRSTDAALARTVIIPLNEVSDGHWHITPEGMRDDEYTRSIRIVEDALDALYARSPHAWRVIDSMFHVDAGHTDLEDLQDKATEYDSAYNKLSELRIALYLLMHTAPRGSNRQLLIDTPLFADFPRKLDTRTDRRRKMEKDYGKYASAYSSIEASIKAASAPGQAYVNRSLERTAQEMGVAKSTIERALKFQRKQAQ